MEQNKRIIWINLALLLAYTIIIRYAGETQDDKQHNFVLKYSMHTIRPRIEIDSFLVVFFYFNRDKNKQKSFSLVFVLLDKSLFNGL